MLNCLTFGLEDFNAVAEYLSTREALKACIAYAADREHRFMTAPSA